MAKVLQRIMEIGTMVSTLALLGSVLLQVFARFFLPSAPSWTEEASRLFFVYAIAFAAGLALKDGYYVHLDLFYNRLPKQIKSLLGILIPLMILTLFGLMAAYSIQFVQLGHAEFSPSLKFRMSVAFSSMFVMAASLAVYAGQTLIKAFKKKEA